MLRFTKLTRIYKKLSFQKQARIRWNIGAVFSLFKNNLLRQARAPDVLHILALAVWKLAPDSKHVMPEYCIPEERKSLIRGLS
jgi:hypothetical protein